MEKLSQLLSERVLLSDGSMGALLASKGYAVPCPDELASTEPQVIKNIHRAYLDAGADIIIADSFGATEPVLAHKGRAGKSAEFTRAAVALARQTAKDTSLVAVDMGPTGEFIYPVGARSFDEVYGWFYTQACAARDAGADFAFIETQTDLAECRAACLAARDAGLEAIASFSVSEKGRTLTGASVEACAVTLEAAGASAVGINCSTGPEAMPASVRRMRKVTALPIAVQPNAGLPVTHADGSVTYPCTPAEFENGMREILCAGAGLIGGCCGTTPEHVARIKPLAENARVPERVSEGEYLSSARECFAADAALACPENVSDPEDAYDADEDTTVLVVSDSEFTPDMLLELASYTKLPVLIEGTDESKTAALLRVYPGRAAVKGCPQAAAKYGAYIVK
ncbi:MAG: homocysteine S-methyltransferase family protein [Clostridia bacterium]|nr:homocysteine S-methyltransferase family protein [Clostridia bacterium]